MASSETALSFSRLGREIASPVIVDLMARALANPDLLSLAAGFTDNVALPRGLVGRFAAELTQGGLDDEPLQYGQNQGRSRLRELSCQYLAAQPGECAEAFDPAAMFISNGSQQALYLAVQALCDPGDIVLVEEPSYFVCLEMLRGLGLRPIGIPCEGDGAIQADGLAELLRELDSAGERSKVKAIYLVSYFCNPSSRSLSLGEKRAIARVLLDVGYEIPVIEDAAYRELYFDAPHPRTIDSKHAGVCSVSKTLPRHLHQALRHRFEDRLRMLHSLRMAGENSLYKRASGLRLSAFLSGYYRARAGCRPISRPFGIYTKTLCRESVRARPCASRRWSQGSGLEMASARWRADLLAASP